MPSPPLLAPGVRFMALLALAFSAMNVLVKQAGTRLPTQEIVFVRSLVSLAISLALLRRARVRGLGTRRGLLLLRGLWGYSALSCVFYAVSHLPLAEATMIQYLHPTLTALLAALVLGERGDRGLVASLVLGTAGVALVVRPAFLFGGAAAPLDAVAVAAALAGAALTAVAYVGVRELSRSEHPLVIVPRSRSRCCGAGCSSRSCRDRGRRLAQSRSPPVRGSAREPPRAALRPGTVPAIGRFGGFGGFGGNRRIAGTVPGEPRAAGTAPESRRAGRRRACRRD